MQSGVPSYASSNSLSGEVYTHIGCISYHNLAWVGHCLVGLFQPPLPYRVAAPPPLWIDPHLILLTGKQWKEEQGQVM